MLALNFALLASVCAIAHGASTPPVGPVIGILTQDCEDDCPAVSYIELGSFYDRDISTSYHVLVQ